MNVAPQLRIDANSQIYSTACWKDGYTTCLKLHKILSLPVEKANSLLVSPFFQLNVCLPEKSHQSIDQSSGTSNRYDAFFPFRNLSKISGIRRLNQEIIQPCSAERFFNYESLLPSLASQGLSSSLLHGGTGTQNKTPKCYPTSFVPAGALLIFI